MRSKALCKFLRDAPIPAMAWNTAQPKISCSIRCYLQRDDTATPFGRISAAMTSHRGVLDGSNDANSIRVM